MRGRDTVDLAGTEGGHLFLGRFSIVGLILAILFWALETVAHALVFRSGTFLEEAFPADPNELWMRCVIFALFLVSGLVVQAYVTRLQRSETSNRLLAQAVNQAGESIILTDTEGRIEYVNPAFSRVTGYSLEEIQGETPRLLKSGAQNAGFYDQLWQTITTGQVWQGQVTDRRKDGTFYPALLTIAPVLDQNGVATHYMGIQLDRSEQIALEEKLRQARKVEALGTLVGGIAHDFNNVLATIIAHTDLGGLRAHDPGDVKTSFERIRIAADGAAGMVAHLLAFVRQRRDDEEKEAPQVDLRSWFTNLRPSLEASIPQTIAFELELEESALGVGLPSFQLQEIVQNLVANAVDAMDSRPEGKIRIEVSTLPDGSTGRPAAQALGGVRCVRLRVIDDGPGIPPEQVERIFDPFFTTKPAGVGTGLGLAMVLDIVKHAGGVVSCVPGTDSGTIFEILLPWIEVDEEVATAGADTIEEGRGQTILLVEDQELFRETARALLESLGYRTLTAANGQEAIDRFRNDTDRIDLVLLDVTMPVMNGTEAARQIRALQSEIPIIFSTGYDHGLLDGFVLQGPEPQLLQKPFDIGILSRLLAKSLEHGPEAS